MRTPPHRNRLRRAALAGLAVGATGLALLVPAGSASAATTYTWTKGMAVAGADHHSWTDPRNWSPQGVPGDGDSVVVPAIAGQGSVPVDGIPDVTLADLTLSGNDDSTVYLGAAGEALSVTGSFIWTSGRITADVTLTPTAHGTVAGAGFRDLWGTLTVDGRLDLTGSTTRISWGHAITVGSGGTLNSSGTTELVADGCCSDALRNDGAVDVSDGVLRLDGVELDQTGGLTVAAGARLEATGGQARLGPDAQYAGAGTLAFDHTAGPDPDPDHPAASQGAVLVSGRNTLTDGFTLAAGKDAILTGVGSFAGQGSLELRGATVYAKLGLGHAVRLDVAGRDLSRLGTWSANTPGYVGAVTTTGPATVERGARLDVDPGSRLTLGRGAALALATGGTIGSRACCSSSPQLVTLPGSTMALGDAPGTVHLTWLHVRTSGTSTVAPKVTAVATEGPFEQRAGRLSLPGSAVLRLRETSLALAGGVLAGTGDVRGAVTNSGGTVQPGTSATPASLDVGSYRQGRHGRLVLDATGSRVDRLLVDGSARLGGRLVVAGGRPARGRHATVVKAGHRSGRFAHVSARRWTVRYSRKAVALDS